MVAFFWGAKCHEELDLFPHGSIGREAVAIQSAMLPCENSGEIIQSEYCTTKIMAFVTIILLVEFIHQK